MTVDSDLKSSASNLKNRFLQQPLSYGETYQCYSWQPKPRIIGTDLERSSSDRKQRFLWNVSMLSISANAYDGRYWFEEFFSNLKPTISATTFFLIVKRLSVVNDNQSLGSSVLIWGGLLWIWNQGFCNNHFLIAKHLSVVDDRQSRGSSVLIRRSLLRIWNQRFLQQPFFYGEKSQCFPWPQTSGIICTGLKRSASNLKPTFLQHLFSYGETSQCGSWQPKPWMICTDLKRSASSLKPPVFATLILSLWNVSVLSMTARA